MVIGIISDIHSNHLALQSCLEILHAREQVDQVYFLGDSVGYFTNVNEVLETLQQENVECLLGNHDAMLLGILPLDVEKDKVYQIGKSRGMITTSNLAFLSSLLPYKTVVDGQFKILMVHGSPYNPLEGYVYENSVLTGYEQLGYDFIFMGHTHRPFIKKTGICKVVNVGSVGLPRDIGNLGSFAVLNTETKQVDIKRFEIDTKEVILKNEILHPQVLDCMQRKREIN